MYRIDKAFKRILRDDNFINYVEERSANPRIACQKCPLPQPLLPYSLMTSNRRYKPLISSAKSVERGAGTLVICKLFPCVLEAFLSTSLRIERRIMNENDGTHHDFQVAEGWYS